MRSSRRVGSDGDRIRLFVGLPLPAGAVEGLAAWQAQGHLEAEDVRTVASENVHITLAFLGSRPESELPEIVRVVRAAARQATPPTLTVERYRETRSVGMLELAEEDGAAAGLAGDVQDRLERLGVYRREQRPWLPHVTVLRFSARPGLRPPVPDLGPVSPSDAAIYHAVLRQGGAQYRIVESVALGGG